VVAADPLEGDVHGADFFTRCRVCSADSREEARHAKTVVAANAANAANAAMARWRGGAVAVPLIERIRSVSTFATPSTWQVDTDRGATELVLKVEEDIRRLPGAKRLLITSGSGVVFEIRDRHRLDRTSQRLLERFL
jgi:hypothetical protein